MSISPQVGPLLVWVMVVCPLFGDTESAPGMIFPCCTSVTFNSVLYGESWIQIGLIALMESCAAIPFGRAQSPENPTRLEFVFGASQASSFELGTLVGFELPNHSE